MLSRPARNAKVVARAHHKSAAGSRVLEVAKQPARVLQKAGEQASLRPLRALGPDRLEYDV